MLHVATGFRRSGVPVRLERHRGELRGLKDTHLAHPLSPRRLGLAEGRDPNRCEFASGHCQYRSGYLAGPDISHRLRGGI